MGKLFLLAPLTIGLNVLASASLGMSAPTPGVPRDFSLTMERQACFGFCPMYTVRVDASGTVTYLGDRFVKVKGKQTAKLTKAQLERLVRTLERAKLNQYKAEYTNQDFTDQPSTVLTVRMNGKAQSINHYYGDKSAPRSLKTLEDSIDRLLNTRVWVGERGVIYRE